MTNRFLLLAYVVLLLMGCVLIGWVVVSVARGAPAPHFAARWDGPGRATVSWEQSTRSCLSVQHATGQGVFIGCWEKEGAITITLGHVGPLSGDLRPTVGDLYFLTNGSGVVLGRAPLRSVVYLPAWR